MQFIRDAIDRWKWARASDPLPTGAQRELLGRMIQDAFVEIRYLGWYNRSQRAGDLADVFHNISVEMHGAGIFRWETFRTDLRLYQEKYAEADHEISPRNYVAKLDFIRSNPRAREFPPGGYIRGDLRQE